ncbi:hypothetical protein UFOVP623_3 [uncultured Caudovirales phage]|uniref:Uncharacterized protein n=1 Tax=uncultured Caudovirales phage TaxID=2100421 RepID=A0A6J5N3R4_9CAUD|nr:hypothetical protein UFOVP623_3 [uncultured Caudovirales phage]
MIKIFYDVKNTSATTNYMSISKQDMDYLISTVISIQSYMSELSLCPDKDVKDLLKWYKSPSKTLPYHSKWKKYNSPQTFISGTLNNIMFGSQVDLSEIQGQHLQNIISIFSGLVEVLKDMKIDLQKSHNIEPIMFVENLWEMK